MGGGAGPAVRVGRLRIRSGDARRKYVEEHFFLFFTAACAAGAGPLFFTFPELLDRSALGMTLPLLVERLWALSYTLAGWLMVIGMLRPDARMEMAGLVMLSAAYASEMYAAVAARGTGGVLIVLLLLGPAVGAMIRAYVLRFEPESQPWRQRRSMSS